MDDAKQYADEIYAIHRRADQIEWHMESAGFSESEISEQLQRLGYRRVYALETCSPR